MSKGIIDIDLKETTAELPMKELVAALRKAFKEGAEVPLRTKYEFNNGCTLLMPSWNTKYYALKIVNIYPENSKKNMPGLHSTVQLFDATTGKPLANLHGDTITSRRTAAAAALGASFLARPDSKRLTMVGCGRVASLVPEAMAAVLPIEEVVVWNIVPQGVDRMVAQLKKLGLKARYEPNLQKAVEGADVVSCATLSTAPMIKAEWLKPDSHLDLIGAFTPDMQEADPKCFANAKVFVDTMEAPTKAGDLLRAFKAGTLTKEAILGTAEQLCRGEKQGRQPGDGRTVYKAVGTALEDLAAAVMAYEGHVKKHPSSL